MDTKDISVVLAGEAGQGIQTIEYLLTHILKEAGFHVFSTKEFMSRIRGGNNSTTIRISSNRVAAYVDRIDILVPLNKDSIEHVEKRISKNTIILVDEQIKPTRYKCINIPFSQLSRHVGGTIYKNIIAASTILSLFKVDKKIIDNHIRSRFLKKGQDVVDKNILASNKGYEVGNDLLKSGKIKMQLEPHIQTKNELMLSGTEAVALGAIAGGCNLITAYPMTPASGVFSFLAQHAKDFEIIAEQAEDEISAMNMAIGGWYAGGRAMTTTSGGGFDLMTEGLSLAGMQETPMVIHLSQRPGPATGLPTRTEQADLELALYAGHGEFPRIILTPGKLEDAFYLTQQAFNLADKYQVPVFVLTDQFFVDSYYNIPSLTLADVKVNNYFVKTEPGYKRYQINDTGISPRGIPGFGMGFVHADCHVHDEEGHISENLDLRTKMVNKYLRKMEQIKNNALGPELVGTQNYKNLIVSWGSNYHVVREALNTIKKNDTAFLHFKQVYPFPIEALDLVKNASNLIVVENNATSQFAKLIRLETGISIKNRILKYNGLPFSTEEVIEELHQYLP